MHNTLAQVMLHWRKLVEKYIISIVLYSIQNESSSAFLSHVHVLSMILNCKVFSAFTF